MIAGMSNAEYDRRRQISVRLQADGPRRTSLSEIMDLGRRACPAFAKRPDFRKYALKNIKNNEDPAFKVSVTEIYDSCNVQPVSFLAPNQPSSYGRKRMSAPKLPVTRSRYVAIHHYPAP